MHDHGSVRVVYKPASDTSYVHSISEGTWNGQLRFDATLIRAGRAPAPFPAPFFNFIVGGIPARVILAQSGHPDLTMVLDDTNRIHLGPGIVGNYSGPYELSRAPVTAMTLPDWAIAVARARTAKVIIDSTTLRLSTIDIANYQAFYRFAVCDTVPLK